MIGAELKPHATQLLLELHGRTVTLGLQLLISLFLEQCIINGT